MSRRDPQNRFYVGLAAAAVTAVATLVVVLVPTWDVPWPSDPIRSQEWGWRGLAMDTFTSERTRNNPYDVVPEPVAAVEPAGEPASEVYENLEVLGHLDVEEFNRLMQAMTEWVSPEAGCEYCHNIDEGFASDSVYTKGVARVMLAMTQNINANWSDNHVGPTGVTCYTCHRGNPIPPYHWFKAAEPTPPMGGIVGKPPPWVRTATTIRDFLPRGPFEDYLLNDKPITGTQTRAVAGHVADLSKMEDIYLVMMQMADGMGVNCNYCHNSRAFSDWNQSTPQRITGWYAIRMTRQINQSFITPIAKMLPAAHKGPLGDAAKADCMTCHIGATKPLNGAPMLADYPSLAAPSPTVAAQLKRYLDRQDTP